MDNTRKKLIELIGQVQDDGCDYTECFSQWDRPMHIDNSVLADHLIANGVTIQKWISVKDRLPETKTEVLVYTGTSIFSHTFFATDSIIQSGITHWMPLPKAPKGD